MNNPLLCYNKLNEYIENYKNQLETYKIITTYNNIPKYKRKYIIDIINDFDFFYYSKYIYFNDLYKKYYIEYNKLIKNRLTMISREYTEESKNIIKKQNYMFEKITNLLETFIINNNNTLNFFFKLYSNEIDENYCNNCLNYKLINDNYECEYCGYIDETIEEVIISKHTVNFHKKSKVSSTESRYKYIVFKLNELQSKYNPTIPNEIYININNYITLNNIDVNSLNILSIRKILNILNYIIYYKYTRIILKNIKNHSDYCFNTEQENAILSEFKIINNSIEKLNINMPDFNYIIWNILKRLKYPCKAEHFDIAKTEDKQKNQELLMRKILKDINWTYYPFF